ncbi:TPA: hypothetical protein N0F65_007111, partial [Lagenidium giganteum]
LKRSAHVRGLVERQVGVDADVSGVDAAYVHDGKTTYCWHIPQSVKNTKLTEDDRTDVSVGQACPLEMTLELSSTSLQPFEHVNVTWTVETALGSTNGINFTKIFYGHAMDGKVGQIVHSNVHSCAYGTGCDAFSDGKDLVDNTVNQVANFTNNKAVFNETIRFTQTGEYSVLAHIILPDRNETLQRFDFAVYKNVTVTATAANSTKMSPATGPAQTNDPIPVSQQKSGGLTDNQLIAVIVGSVSAVIVAIIIAACIVQRSSKKDKSGEIEAPSVYECLPTVPVAGSSHTESESWKMSAPTTPSKQSSASFEASRTPDYSSKASCQVHQADLHEQRRHHSPRHSYETEASLFDSHLTTNTRLREDNYTGSSEVDFGADYLDTNSSTYVHDGKTTYCWHIPQSVKNTKLTEDDRTDVSVGQACPLKMTVELSSTMLQPFEELNVTWTVEAALGPTNGINFTKIFYGHAIDGKVGQIVHSNVHSCVYGTGCDAFSDGKELVDKTVNQVANFTNNKAVFKDVLRFTQQGDYSVLAHIILPDRNETQERFDFAVYKELTVTTAAQTLTPLQTLVIHDTTVYFYCINCGLVEMPRLLGTMPRLQEIALANSYVENVARSNVVKNAAMIVYYVHNGVTTYCWHIPQSIKNTKLNESDRVDGFSTTDCPLQITVNFSSDVVRPFEVVNVKWRVVADFTKGKNGVNLTQLFAALDSSGGVHQIVHSNVHSCVYGTGCDPFNDGKQLVDKTTNKVLNFTDNVAEFTDVVKFPDVGDYSILAHIIIPDQNASASRFDFAVYTELSVENTLPTPAPAPTPSAAPIASATSAPVSTEGKSQGVSTAVTIGIIAGAVVLIVALLVFAYVYKKKHEAAAASGSSTHGSYMAPPPSYSNTYHLQNLAPKYDDDPSTHASMSDNSMAHPRGSTSTTDNNRPPYPYELSGGSRQSNNSYAPPQQQQQQPAYQPPPAQYQPPPPYQPPFPRASDGPTAGYSQQNAAAYPDGRSRFDPDVEL